MLRTGGEVGEDEAGASVAWGIPDSVASGASAALLAAAWPSPATHAVWTALSCVLALAVCCFLLVLALPIH